MTYYGKISNKINNFFKQQKINIAFKTNNKLQNLIPMKINNTDKYTKCGIYKLNCKNCSHKYIGQTQRNFRTRYNEHKADFKFNRNKSKYALHLINTGHELTNITDTLTIVKTLQNCDTINTLEEYTIVKNIRQGQKT